MVIAATTKTQLILAHMLIFKYFFFFFGYMSLPFPRNGKTNYKKMIIAFKVMIQIHCVNCSLYFLG